MAKVGSFAEALCAGRTLFDNFDHYVTAYGFFLVGALESIAIGWVWGWQETKSRYGALCAATVCKCNSFWDLIMCLPAPCWACLAHDCDVAVSAVWGASMTYANCNRLYCGYRSAGLFTYGSVAACLIGAIVSGALHHDTSDTVNIGIGIATGVCTFLGASFAAFFARHDYKVSAGEWISVVSFAGTRELRRGFKQNTGSYTPQWREIMHMFTFDAPIKYICPPVFTGAHARTPPARQALRDGVPFAKVLAGNRVQSADGCVQGLRSISCVQAGLLVLTCMHDDCRTDSQHRNHRCH